MKVEAAKFLHFDINNASLSASQLASQPAGAKPEKTQSLLSSDQDETAEFSPMISKHLKNPTEQLRFRVSFSNYHAVFFIPKAFYTSSDPGNDCFLLVWTVELAA